MAAFRLSILRRWIGGSKHSPTNLINVIGVLLAPVAPVNNHLGSLLPERKRKHQVHSHVSNGEGHNHASERSQQSFAGHPRPPTARQIKSESLFEKKG
jgi:hypothetical protein